MNQIFGYQISYDAIAANDIVFEDAQPVLPSTKFKCKSRQLKLFAQPNSHLLSCWSQKYRAYSYVWGIPAHPDMSTHDIPEWSAKAVAEKCYDRFRELIGTFVVIIDEPEQNSITLVTDILGVRPMFLGKHNGRIVFGSNVWPIQKAGLSSGAIDYDAVSAWIAYGFNCTDGTLFSDLHRLPPGCVLIFQDGKSTKIPYVKFENQSQPVAPDRVSEDLHEIASYTVKTLLANHSRISIALSGGYDSRYLLALSLALAESSVKSILTVSYTDNERRISSQVAETLGVPLQNLEVSGSIWDLYDQVHHFTADGFPISKFVTYLVAQHYPGMPMVNGFMGDSLVRGSKDTFQGKYETEWDNDLAEILQRKHLLVGSKVIERWFRREIAKRILMRSRLPMEEAVRKGSSIGKVFAWADFYYRQRYYISNNFLQHIGLAEALLPFYSWELLSYKMGYDYKLFSRDIYYMIFQRYFATLADIPHASDLPHNKSRSSLGKVARCTRRWARQLLPVLCDRDLLSLLSKKRCIPLTVAGIAGFRRAEKLIFTFERLYLLEKRVRNTGLDFDWDCI